MLSPSSSPWMPGSTSGCSAAPTWSGRYAGSSGVRYGLCIATAMRIDSLKSHGPPRRPRNAECGRRSRQTRHNGRYRLFLQSFDLWSACESRPFPPNEPRIGVFQAQREPHRNCQTPFITFHSRFWHPPQTHPAPVTHFGGILHRFPMNTLPVRDLKTVFEI